MEGDKDVTSMIRDLSKKVGTSELNEWDTDFVESLVVRMNAGQVTKLHERQVHSLKNLHARVFGPRRIRQVA